MTDQDDFLPSHASVAVLVGRGWRRRWAHGGSEGDDSGEDAECVMKRMCLSTQSVLSASPASIDTIRSTCLWLGSALEAAVLVVAPSPSPSPSPSAVRAAISTPGISMNSSRVCIRIPCA